MDQRQGMNRLRRLPDGSHDYPFSSTSQKVMVEEWDITVPKYEIRWKEYEIQVNSEQQQNGETEDRPLEIAVQKRVSIKEIDARFEFCYSEWRAISSSDVQMEGEMEVSRV